VAHNRSGAESSIRCNLLQATAGRLEQLLRAQDALPVEPGGWRRARVGAEPARERARRHQRPTRQLIDGEIRVEVRTQQNRTQVVTLAVGNDPEGDQVAYLWSVAGHISTARDLAAVMRFSIRLTYGCTAIKDDNVVVKHSLRVAGSDDQTFRKALFFVARAADTLEAEAYGGADHN